jgi:hypothetical protein
VAIKEMTMVEGVLDQVRIQVMVEMVEIMAMAAAVEVTIGTKNQISNEKVLREVTVQITTILKDLNQMETTIDLNKPKTKDLSQTETSSKIKTTRTHKK